MELLIVLTICINIGADQIDRSAISNGDPISMATWSAIAQFLLILPLIGLVATADLKLFFYGLVTGSISAAGRLYWYKALSKREASLTELAPFNQFSHVFVMILALLVFGEQPGGAKLFGAMLIIASTILMQLRDPKEQIFHILIPSLASLTVLVFAFSNALTSIYYKALLIDGMDLLSVYFYLKLFQVIFLVIAARWSQIVEAGGAILSPQKFAVARMLQTVAAFIYLFVLSRADLSEVQPVAALSPFLIFVWDYIASIGKPTENRPPASRIRLYAVVTLALGIYFFVSN